jgi:hypothetical protein
MSIMCSWIVRHSEGNRAFWISFVFVSFQDILTDLDEPITFFERFHSLHGSFRSSEPFLLLIGAVHFIMKLGPMY